MSESSGSKEQVQSSWTFQSEFKINTVLFAPCVGVPVSFLIGGELGNIKECKFTNTPGKTTNSEILPLDVVKGKDNLQPKKYDGRKNNSIGRIKYHGHTSWVNALCFTKMRQNGHTTMVSGSADTTIIVWNHESGEVIRKIETKSGRVFSLALTPDDKKIVSGSDDKTAKLWDINTGDLLHTFEGHLDSVFSVAVHPKGKLIASGSKDKRWKLWGIDKSGWKLLHNSYAHKR